jgi:methionyl-tRNA synthetase
VLAEVIRRLAILSQPVLPRSMARMLDQLGVGADARTFAALETSLAAGTSLPAPEGVFPRYVEPDNGDS